MSGKLVTKVTLTHDHMSSHSDVHTEILSLSTCTNTCIIHSLAIIVYSTYSSTQIPDQLCLLLCKLVAYLHLESNQDITQCSDNYSFILKQSVHGGSVVVPSVNSHTNNID